MSTPAAETLHRPVSLARPQRITWLYVPIILGLIVVLYAKVVPDLASDWWTDPAASYGMLIPPTALVIVYLRRDFLLAIPSAPAMRGLWLVTLGCLLLILGGLAGEFYLARISLVILLAGITWAFWGWRRFREMLFPFILLATMVPLPVLVYNLISAPLQLVASGLATDLAQLLGVSIYRDGNIIHLANTSLGVAEACSGLQSLSAMVVASLLIGYLDGTTVFKRICLVLFSVPLAIAMNVLRVTGTAIIADYRVELAMGFYHLFTGWLTFLVGFSLLWLSGKVLFRRVAEA